MQPLSPLTIGRLTEVYISPENIRLTKGKGPSSLLYCDSIDGRQASFLFFVIIHHLPNPGQSCTLHGISFQGEKSK